MSWHLSWADGGFVFCLEIQESLNTHGASLSLNCDSSVFQLVILMELAFHGGNLNCYDLNISREILTLHPDTDLISGGSHKGSDISKELFNSVPKQKSI